MIVRCPNCGGAITYDPSSADFMCDMCGSIFLAKDIVPEDAAIEENVDNLSPDEVMDYKVYVCKSCSAELLVNDVEAATFCAYCGQPTIVFDRIAKHRKPKYIIPFSVSKNQALTIIKNYINKSDFVPEELKNLQIDVLRGIYVPFWLYDIYCHDCQYLKGTVGTGENRTIRHFLRDATHTFRRITVDASVKFDNTSSRRLEPFDMSYLVPFKPEYLSGFYADCSDEDMKALDMLAKTRANTLFNRKIRETISADGITVESSVPICTIKERNYALLPVWFLVFRHDDTPYTLLVNGQSGKLVGAIPTDENAVKSKILVWSIIFSLIALFICGISDSLFGFEYSIGVGGLFIISGVAAFSEAKTNWRSYKISRMLSSETGADDYASDREGDLK